MAICEMKSPTVSRRGTALLITVLAGAGFGCESDDTSAATLPEPVLIEGMPGASRAADDELAISPSGATCRGYFFPVVERDGATTVHDVFAQLCTRQELNADTPVQILLHGGAYDHSYWDWPHEPETYSYVAHATARGFVTLNVDRLGYGRSDHPDPQTLDFEVAGYVTHQLVQYLRRGVFGVPFETVILNGHSMGGITAERAAATFGDVDAVIISGIASGPPEGEEGDEEGAEDEETYPFYPIEQDPKFADKGWPIGYYTTIPGSRADVFLHEGSYDPAIAQLEESLKDTLTVAELRSVRPDTDDEGAPPEREVDAPTLHALGRHDALFCSATGDCTVDLADADQYFIVSDSGHSINMCRGVSLFYEKTFSWLEENGVGD